MRQTRVFHLTVRKLVFLAGLTATLFILGGGIMLASPRLAPADTRVAVPAAMRSAAAQLRSGRPTLFLFTPVDRCRAQYCLTPDIIAAQLTSAGQTGVDVFEVPVWTTTVTGPIIADWDLHLVEPFARWAPTAAEIFPDAGQADGPAVQKLVLVDAGGDLVATMHGGDDLATLSRDAFSVAAR